MFPGEIVIFNFLLPSPLRWARAAIFSSKLKFIPQKLILSPGLQRGSWARAIQAFPADVVQICLYAVTMLELSLALGFTSTKIGNCPSVPIPSQNCPVSHAKILRFTSLFLKLILPFFVVAGLVLPYVPFEKERLVFKIKLDFDVYPVFCYFFFSQDTALKQLKLFIRVKSNISWLYFFLDICDSSEGWIEMLPL